MRQGYLTRSEKKALAEIRLGVVALVGERLKRFKVFGSKARGDFDPESDVDVAIVVDSLDPQTKHRIIDLVVTSEMRHLVVVSSLVMSWKDFLGLLRRERRIAMDIEKEGVPA